ncbi:UDP-N-acetylglucosamine 2-epimerase [Sphingorhabdus sp.]|uniref:UDP-N-acetylglucosamine 2-epimerase n=1 Tax=Sphingorhabdus sp. TaxID=1902408 RepID=UPI0035B10340
MTRRICFVTGTRAEYGLLRGVLEVVRDEPGFELQLLATGSHLSPEFGLTYREIEADGFRIDSKVEILLSSDTPTGTAKSMGLAMIGFADALATLSPNLIVVLGDRFEIFAAAAAALVARIPIAHIHGGEITEGAFDDALRHSISKLAQLHFVAADSYRQRVIQLGEDPERVFTVGGLGVDAIARVNLMTRSELESSLGFRFRERNLLVTYHPATLDEAGAEQQMAALLTALGELNDVGVVITLPNADAGGRALMQQIRDFVAPRVNAVAFASLGLRRYLSCMAQVDGVVGNSSSGLLEAPALRKGTVNIGDRQQGRLKAASVIDCAADAEAIGTAIARLFSEPFQSTLAHVANPYGDAGASGKIVEVLRRTDFRALIKKRFYDLPDCVLGKR